jgi:hypothetical protein
MSRWLSDGFIYIDRDYPWEQHPGKSGLGKPSPRVRDLLAILDFGSNTANER